MKKPAQNITKESLFSVHIDFQQTFRSEIPCSQDVTAILYLLQKYIQSIIGKKTAPHIEVCTGPADLIVCYRCVSLPHPHQA